ncbi:MULTISPECIES: WecB/TagA/CpsF family glycosyltransferase [unclassified Paenibacillus]|uniref:WecB/TagA/CpsF family glycosyltransferase n=1 Tax=unclassified Paenibacillus TaxID=185978 RepID=UPI000C27363D|nr:WecB/TagA/CpsF family glycosyltransferase [Paenibacillus sp. GM1FR]PJN58872.1 putative N-acetylmannosaminyltransferase [Paenibacillus sp. GM1FR]
MSQTGSIPTVSIYGIPFSKLTMKETVKVLQEAVLSKQTPHQVITANPIMVMAALENPAIMEVMQAAELIVPDGTGVVWAANYCGDPVAERVPGFELLHELLRVGENYRWGVYLLGSTPEVIQETAVRLQQQYPAIRIVGYRDGYFGPAEDEQVVASIREAAPDLLFVARGADTQEPWIHKHKDALQVPVTMGVGGSFDVISGKTKRAPMLFQKLRLEWFYRLLREPSRAGRMLALPKFAVKVMRDKENVTKVR